MNAIEEKLWNYIDGTCSPEEQQAISILIDTDEVYKQKYTELLQLNADFGAMELDEPSMAFTYNVMETIRTENALKPLKAKVDTRIIWGIGGFFVLTITALLVFVLASINWQQTGHASTFELPKVDLNIPKVQDLFNGNIMRGFVLFDLVLALFVLDTFLRKKLNSKQTQ
ncbi:MAG: hypothetical protein ABIN91_12780 [Mucilaginibacter sp.]|uniref:hypothetical protein n=1 Tax=Mucilaginibacter sp. TaxID=1882438 RepID=UPI003267C100